MEYYTSDFKQLTLIIILFDSTRDSKFNGDIIFDKQVNRFKLNYKFQPM